MPNDLMTYQSDAEIQSQWRSRQKKLTRFKSELPDLTDIINPDHSQTTEIIARLRKFEDERAGLTANTLKMLFVALRKYRDFCVVRNQYAFPSENNETVKLFIMSLTLDGKSISTINQYRNQLTFFYRYLGIENPAESFDVKEIMKSLKQDHVEISGEAYRQKQSPGFRRCHLEALIESNNSLSNSPISWRNIKDVALLSMLYGTALRENEICHLRKRDIKIKINSDGKVEVKVIRTRSKTTLNVKDKWLLKVSIAPFMRYFKVYSEQLNDNDYIFSHSFSAYNPISPKTAMSAASVNRAFKRQFKRLEDRNEIVSTPLRLPQTTFTGHGGRIGRVQDGYQIEKLGPSELMRIGDWTTFKMVALYLRELDDY